MNTMSSSPNTLMFEVLLRTHSIESTFRGSKEFTFRDYITTSTVFTGYTTGE